MRHILVQGAAELGLALSDAQLEQFERYFAILTEKNRVMNLTAITEEADAARLHFLDCLALLPLGGFEGASVIDIGSGAGFPGVPLKIAREDIALTLLDAQQKRVGFLEELCRALGLEGVRCLHARAEEAALLPEMRDAFDVAVSRAVARLNVLIELCLPFVRPGGRFIAMKGPESDDEIREAARGAEILGAELETVRDYVIPGTDVRHRAVVYRKKRETPKGYPRRFAKIQKNPL
ncbi:MAG: 16S rRNA (guanine(527)-N(7))-methyltransferase RsmG [Clostridiales bacterium]|nr:16S rRNA (guanine(527)-N(7))-methyltransferase RsmG [Clostridiales bacterium]